MKATTTMTDETIKRFLNAVEGLFENDSEWSIFDLDGAKEFYEEAMRIPSASALAPYGKESA